jgi:hypothetical protein
MRESNMSGIEPITPEELRVFWEHVRKVSSEVRGWPEWKKAFACEIYSLPLSALEEEKPGGRNPERPRT